MILYNLDVDNAYKIFKQTFINRSTISVYHQIYYNAQNFS